MKIILITLIILIAFLIGCSQFLKSIAPNDPMERVMERVNAHYKHIDDSTRQANETRAFLDSINLK